MTLIYIKRAQMTDVDACMAVIDSAKALLKSAGSPQWQDGYPNRAGIAKDIAAGATWLLMVGDQIAGTASLVAGDEPTYREVTDGAWANADPYVTIHRIAISADYRGQHLSQFFMSNLITQAYAAGVYNVRADTHRINTAMQRIMVGCGFELRGRIFIDHGTDRERLAFELNL